MDRPFASFAVRTIRFSISPGVIVLLAIIPAVLIGGDKLGAQTPSVFSSFHVVDMKNRGEERAPVITALAMDAAKNLLATAGDDHRIRIFAGGGEQLLTTWTAEGWVFDLSFDPGASILGAVDELGVLSVWDVNSGQRLYRLPLSGAGLRAVAFAPDGTLLAVAGFEPSVWLVEPSTGRIIRRLSNAGKDLRDVAFSPDGRLVAATGGSGRVQIWSLASGELAADLAVSTRRQHALAFAPTGPLFAVAGEDSVIRVFRLDQTPPAAVITCTLHEGQVTSLVFCNAGRDIAAGTSRNDIRIFDITTGHETARLRGHTGTVVRLIWTPGQEVLASGSFDTTIRFWRLPAETAVGERPVPGGGLRQ